ncbi:MAG: rod shape-determining protein MreC [Candidatus Aminicenantia bacterium]
MERRKRLSDILSLSLSLIFFISIFLQTQRGSSLLRLTLSSINSLFSSLFHSIISNSKELGEYFKDLEKLKKEKEELEKINIDLKTIILKLENELNKYKKAVNLPENNEIKFIIAETIGYDITNPYHSIFINKGENDGIRNYLPVADRELNVIGRILRTNPFSSEVILITSADFSASVKLRDGVLAILSGENSSHCTLNYLTDSSAIREGDEIITSGFDRIFPAGLKIGRIEKIFDLKKNQKSFMVRPYMSLKSIDLVLVLIK